MIHCISVQNMRESDTYTIENLIPSLELMHRAAWGVFKSSEWNGKTAIVVGSGNNGGDGFALACILRSQGYDCTVFTVSDRFSPDSVHFAAKAEGTGVSILSFTPECLQGYDKIVDCLLGTGFQGIVRGTYRIAIETINASDAHVISVDINSGMNGDTGEAELAVQSDLTVTIGYVKAGLVSQNAGKYMKRLVCADIGIELFREEWHIGEDSCGIPCPTWLDMEPIICREPYFC